MTSTADNVVPFLAAPKTLLSQGALCFSPAPGLGPEAIQGLEASFPGTLTHEMRSLLGATCGLTSLEFGSIDFTGRWYPDETVNVHRPCLTESMGAMHDTDRYDAGDPRTWFALEIPLRGAKKRPFR